MVKTKNKIEAEFILEKLIEDLKREGISKLLTISKIIDEAMEADPKIKPAAVPDVLLYGCVDPETKKNYSFCPWDDFRTLRKKHINDLPGHAAFLLGGVEEDDLDQIGYLKIIQDDCNDMIDFIKNAKPLNPSSFIKNIYEDLLIISGRFNHMGGYLGLKYREKLARRNSGMGQKKAQEKRLSKFAETLRQYKKAESNEIKIKKNDFYKLLNQTFEGSENYPRHHSTIKKYREEVEKILGKEIILQ